ncbi:MAG: histidine kinase dimerization/phospho-acceptor domain-containing protein, partial [Bacteroidota bacterium]
MKPNADHSPPLVDAGKAAETGKPALFISLRNSFFRHFRPAVANADAIVGKLLRLAVSFFATLHKLTLGRLIERFSALRLKAKIRIALITLFATVTILGIVGGYYVQEVSSKNLKTMQECRSWMSNAEGMSSALNRVVSVLTLKQYEDVIAKRSELKGAFSEFERYLNRQMGMAMPDSQKIVMGEIQKWYGMLREQLPEIAISANQAPTPFEKILVQDLQKKLQVVFAQNQDFMESKIMEALTTANHITKWMVVFGFVFFVSFLFIGYTFPNYVAKPVQEVTDSIKQVAAGNYTERIHLDYKDEFGDMVQSFNSMAEALEYYDKMNVSQIVSEKQRNETIVSRMNEAIIGLDDHKNVLFVNPPALELVGMTQEELIGQSAASLSKQNDVLKNLLKEVLKTDVKGSKTYPAVSIDKDGKRQYFNKDVLRVESRGVENADEAVGVGYVVILKNVTELKEQDLAKTNFMATLSHELKTPIAAIDMSLNLLEDERLAGGLNEEQKDLSRTIKQNTARLLRMVNEILDISRIETGQLQLHFESAAPDELVVKALENVKTFIAEKEIEILQNIEADLPSLRIDFHKTTAVLVNILTNAVRYSPPSSRVSVKVER